MDRRQVFGWVGILLCLGVPIAWALTGSFSNTVWQIPTLKSDHYYVGSTQDVTGLLSGYVSGTGTLTLPHLIVEGVPLSTYITSVAPGGTSVVTQASPYTYIVSKIAGTYYANSTMGGTNYSGVNATTIIQDAVNVAEAQGGGVVYIKVGHYDLTWGITIDDDNVIIMGEGYEGTQLHCSAGVTAITIGNGSDRIYDCSIQGLFIQHAATYATASKGLYLRCHTHCYFRDVAINGFTYGVQIDSTANPSTYNTYNNIKCISVKYGVYQSGAASDNQGMWSQINLIGVGKAVAGGIGWIHLAGNTNQWESLSVESFETAIDLDIGPTGWNLNNHFVGLFIEDCTTGIDYNLARPGARAQFVGVWMATTTTPIANYVSTRGIDFTGLLITATGARARNMGTTSVATGATIAHGLLLGVTPRICHVTISGATPYKISYTVDATNITVYHDAGGAVNVTWYVEI